jgi:hypothetical protein
MAKEEGRPMTEAEWLACENPAKMLAFGPASASLRKVALFLIACCRNSLDLHPDKLARIALEWAEQSIEAGAKHGHEVPWCPGDNYFLSPATNHCLAATQDAIEGHRSRVLSSAGLVLMFLNQYSRRPLEIRHSQLLRDIIGNPY